MRWGRYSSKRCPVDSEMGREDEHKENTEYESNLLKIERRRKEIQFLSSEFLMI